MTPEPKTRAKRYDFHALEAKWRPHWQAIDLYRTGDDPTRPNVYILDFFPYPSGNGLSVGHCRNYVPTCVSARFHRMRGYNVLHPMGWDAFGLPAENYAIAHAVHPRETTARFTANYKRQMQLVECSYDWSREIDSTDPAYYRWTQWFFLLLFRRGLAYRAPGSQWWCPHCRTILANEQVEDGRCWRCDSEVTRKELEQWYFRITAYADRLLADLDGIDWPEHIKEMQRNWIGRAEEDGPDGPGVTYRLHDWLISRQRYWGAPIPIVYCDACGIVPLPEAELPVLLPDVADFTPADDGRSPLARAESWVNTTCPHCGGPARRETDTMDGFACSSWYFLRFPNPHEAGRPFDPDAVRRWLPVDTYVGGAEHAVMHLLYARFWTKVIHDAGLIDFVEPFTQLRNQGMLLSAVDGQKMSKSRGNVVTPDEVVARHGADALRAYILFLGPFDARAVWDNRGIVGITRFIERYWKLANEVASIPNGAGAYDEAYERERHRIIKRVTEDMAKFRFNTAVAALMEYVNYLSSASGTSGRQRREAIRTLTLLLAPVAPFVTEEVWQEVLGESESIHCAAWPAYDAAQADGEQTVIILQVNGKRRDRILAATDNETGLREAALANEKVQSAVGERPIRNIVIVPGRLVNVVTE